MDNFYDVSDEELLLLSRVGNLTAENALTQRYFSMRFYFSQLASESIASMLDDWTLNEAHFRAFLIAVNNYEFHRARFSTFFVKVLSHELHRSFETRKRQLPYYVTSLDEVIQTKTGEFSLYDIIPSGDDFDDPKAFLLYSEALLHTNSRLPRGIDAKVILIARLSSEGYSRQDIAARVQMNESTVKYSLEKYRRWAMKVLTQVQGLDLSQQREKEKLLSQYFGTGEE